MIARLFPGERRVWLAAAVVAPVLAIYALVNLLGQREALTGTNSVATLTPVGTLGAGERVCDPVRVPPQTGIVQVWVAATSGTLSGTLLVPGEPVQHLGPYDLAQPTTARDLRVAPRAATQSGTLCLRSSQGMTLLGAGVNRLPNQGQMLFAGMPRTDIDLTIRYKSPGAPTRTLLSLLTHAPGHAAVFRPGPIGPWTYWVIALLVLPGLAYSGLRLLATAHTRSGRRLAATVAAIAFGFSACWALTTPLFGAPDEPEHFAYEQYLSETGHTPEQAPGPLPAYATEEGWLLIAMRHSSSLFLGATRPRWLPADEQSWRNVALHVPRTDGGGYNVASSAHSPLYYGAVSPAYQATRWADLTWRVTAVRLLTALIACLVATCAALTVRELAPRRPLLAAAAGVGVALEPTLAFMGGAVNNDSAVNAAAAVAIYLTVRALRRGLTPRLAVGLVLAMIALPLAKIVGFGVLPGVAIGALIALLRAPRAAALRSAAAGAVTFAGVTVAWTKLLIPALESGHGGSLVNAGTTNTSQVAAFTDPKLFLDYFVQTFVPLIHLTGRNLSYGWPAYQVYVKGGFASFGWVTIQFPPLVYEAILGALGVTAVAALVAAWRYRAAVLSRWPAVVTLAVSGVGVFALVAAAYTSAGPRPVPAEQGRYAFPAMVPLASVAVLGCLALGRRYAGYLAGALVTGMIGLGLAGWWLAFSAWFT